MNGAIDWMFTVIGLVMYPENDPGVLVECRNALSYFINVKHNNYIVNID